MFMTDIGHFYRDYAVSDSFAVKALWEHLRFAAGDYQNGCTDPTSSHFNPEARVNDGSCENGASVWDFGHRTSLRTKTTIRVEGLHPSVFALPFVPVNALMAELHDLQGRRVWRQSLHAGGHIYRVAELKPGMYLLRFKDGSREAMCKVMMRAYPLP
jgi:hypothetical protein